MKKDEIDYEHMLTNEQLLKRFKNQFDLVRYSIQLAENAIRSGRQMDIDTDSENLAFQILAEIAANKERFDELPAVQTQARPAQDRFQDRYQERQDRFNSTKNESNSFLEQAREMKQAKEKKKSSKTKAAHK